MPVHDAVVVAVHHTSESNLVVELLTRDAGRFSCVARGARLSQRRFPGGVDVLTRLDADETAPRRGELHTLNAATVTDAFLPLRQDPLAVGRAAYVAEIAAALSPAGHVADETFDILIEAMRALCVGPAGPALLRWAELRLLLSVGELAPMDACHGCSEALESAVHLPHQPGHLWCRSCAPPHAVAVPAPVLELLAQAPGWTAEQARTAPVSPLTSVTAGRMLAPLIRHAVGRPLKSTQYLLQLERHGGADPSTPPEVGT
ncbi:MAG: DNA repair protein RecO [Myxococcota bacterium]